MEKKFNSSFYFQTTFDCNLACAHCFQGSGPNKEHTTISEENFEKVINHLPEDNILLCLTGGEIFKEIDNLWNYLKIIKDKNKQRKSKEKIKIDVQTNGFWATNILTTKEILSELKKYSIRGIDLTSDDGYHFKSGLDKKVIENIEEVNKKYSFIPELEIRGAGGTIFPAGRGKNIIDKTNFYFPPHWGESCKKVFEGEKTLTIDPKGNTYMCCFNMYKLPGNIIENSYDKIISMAKEDPILNKLNDRGIKGVAKLFDIKNKEIEKSVRKHGPCGLCAKLNDLI